MRSAAQDSAQGRFTRPKHSENRGPRAIDMAWGKRNKNALLSQRSLELLKTLDWE